MSAVTAALPSRRSTEGNARRAAAAGFTMATGPCGGGQGSCAKYPRGPGAFRGKAQFIVTARTRAILAMHALQHVLNALTGGCNEDRRNVVTRHGDTVTGHHRRSAGCRYGLSGPADPLHLSLCAR